MKKLLLTLLIGLVAFSLNAQKIGYIDLEKIIPQLPEYKKAQAQWEKELRETQNLLDSLNVVYNRLFNEIQENMQLPENDPKRWSKIVMEQKQQDLVNLQQRILQFQQTAQERLQKRQMELFQPVNAKIDSAVNVIAKNRGYIIVLRNGDVYYFNKDKVDDITADVEKILGLK